MGNFLAGTAIAFWLDGGKNAEVCWGEAGEKIRESVKFDEDKSGCRRSACGCSREHRSVRARARTRTSVLHTLALGESRANTYFFF